MPTNEDFLTALFGADAPWVHVTDFSYDPNHIPSSRHLAAWKGDYFSRYQFGEKTNQYFTISLFYADDQGQARRRKALYRSTPVIVLDDVKEKLAMSEVSKLPEPSWILETSPGSEQWGYILTEPCTERHRVENLLDGLVKNGMAPEGRDPGMKGVTRYVRLPDGYNRKKSKMVGGLPFKCELKVWNPFTRVTLEQLAAPFFVNLDAPRREQRVDGAAQVNDHPLLQVPDVIHIKEVRSEGRFDITCPWVDEHTGSDDSGSAIFTNGDGTIGFKCHHGACQDRTGRHLLSFIEKEYPGFGSRFTSWQTVRSFGELAKVSIPDTPPQMPVPPAPPSARQASDVMPEPEASQVLKQVLGQLRSEPPFSERARELASKLLQAVDNLPTIERLYWHDQVRDVMRWSKPDFKSILNDLRQTWYIDTKKEVSFFDEVIYVGELNQFFDRNKRIFYTAEAYQNAYAHLDSEARKEALQGGRVTKVDKIDYAPKRAPVFEDNGVVYGNSWSDRTEPEGVQGDVSRWVKHFDSIGWTEYRKHLIQWMAFTIRHPDQKINHMLLLGSGEGCGKDFLLYPLVKAMGDNHVTISGEDLLSNFNDYILSTKHLHINEAELGDRREATAIANKIKPLAAAPPDKLRVNPKGVKAINVRNLLSVSMTTNGQQPLRITGPSRRILALWSDMNPRDEWDNMMPEWIDYWKDRWTWMLNGGAEACIWYLRNVVDLSDFNPAAAPPMTDFLRDIREASKTPAQQTIEAFIRQRVGCFRADLITVKDASETLRSGPLVAPSLLYCNPEQFTPAKVSSLLKQVNGCIKLRVESTTIRDLWALRFSDTYRVMAPEHLISEYERQLKESKAASALEVVR